MRNFTMIAAVAAMTAASVAPTAAEAHGRRDRHSHASQYDRGYDDRGYDRRSDDRYYGRTRQRCRSGTTGAILGAAAGALLGREVIGRRGNGTTGTILGAAAGGLGGRALTRDKGCR